jgi:acetolactate synthase-1/2/3 large subunit
MTDKHLTCAQRLTRLLYAYGIDTAFGIPGVHTVELYRDLKASSLRHITPRHEQGAGFMADGYARATGRPAVCFIITGPGMTNIATAMGQALADSIPMLVISSVNRRDTLGLGQGHLHELPDQQATLAGVSVFSHTLQAPEALPEVMARAFSVFKSARPGPVHIEIPLDVMVQCVAASPVRIADIRPPAVSPNALDEAAARLSAASRPLVLLGGGSVAHPQTARALVERLDAPTLTTINAKGVLGCDHPLDLGATASLPASRRLIAAADVVLAIGTELGETDYDLSFDGGFSLTGDLIRIDIDPQQLLRNYPPALAIVAEAGEAMTGLLARLPATPPEREGQARCQATREALALADDPMIAPFVSFFAAIRQAQPEAIIVSDSTMPAYAGNFWATMPAPRRWFSAATGYGTLGYGLPAAIGAALAAPKQPVVAVVGDGGLMFTLGELATARAAGLALAVVVWNNDGYGEIGQYMEAHDIERMGVDFAAPDFPSLAQAFGCHSTKATTPQALTEAIVASHAATAPTLIEVDARQWAPTDLH